MKGLVFYNQPLDLNEGLQFLDSMSLHFASQMILMHTAQCPERNVLGSESQVKMYLLYSIIVFQDCDLKITWIFKVKNELIF